MVFLLSGCADTSKEVAHTESDVTGTVSYVDSLRGANDLAHGSLDAPSIATLAGLAAIAHVDRVVGTTSVVVSEAELAQLALQSPEDSPAVFDQVCLLLEGDADLALDLVGEDRGHQVETLKIHSDERIDDPNSATRFVDAFSAITCLDGEPPQVSDSVQAQLREVLADAPLAWAYARAAGVPGLEGRAEQWERLEADLEGRLQTESCDAWNQAEAAVLATGASNPSAMKRCAVQTTTVLDEPTVLRYLVAAGVPVDVLRSIRESNGDSIRVWADPSDGTDGEPVRRESGLGTLTATRDAFQLLRYTGAEAPSWMAVGVRKAMSAIEGDPDSISDLSAAADVLILCDEVPDACSGSTIDSATTTLRSFGADWTGSSQDRDLTEARIFEAFEVAGLATPRCSAGTVNDWYQRAPATLATLANGQKECGELLGLGRDRSLLDAVTILHSANYSAAGAPVLLHMLTSDGTFDDNYKKTVDDAFDDLTVSMDRSMGVGYMERARPLTVELLRARLANWMAS